MESQPQMSGIPMVRRKRIIHVFIFHDSLCSSRYGNAVGRNIFCHYRICSYPCMMPYRDITDNFCATTYIHIVTDGRSTDILAAFCRYRPNGYLLENHRILPYVCRITNKDSIILMWEYWDWVKLSTQANPTTIMSEISHIDSLPELDMFFLCQDFLS